MIKAYADCLNKVHGETRSSRINLYEGIAVTRIWDVNPEKARIAVNNSTAMGMIVESGRRGVAMEMIDW